MTMLCQEPKTQNWRTGSEDIQLFIDQMEPYIREMYPRVKKIMLFTHLVRGGDKFGDQPA